MRINSVDELFLPPACELCFVLTMCEMIPRFSLVHLDFVCLDLNP